MRGILIAGVTSALGLAACSLFVDRSDYVGGTKAPDGGDGAPVDGGGNDGDASDGAACPGRAPPEMVRVGSFCIDATEVTRADYAAFLAEIDAGADAGATHPLCGWNTDLVPGDDWPPAPGTERYPIGVVDWCDAWTYCAWAGKRLCGRIGGGPTPPPLFEDPAADEWLAACTKAGTQRFPYGTMHDVSACNVGTNTEREVRSSARCEGSRAGLFDMLGNVSEWTDSCLQSNGYDDDCRPRGGSRTSASEPDAGPIDCYEGGGITRHSQYGNVGFRCCAQ